MTGKRRWCPCCCGRLTAIDPLVKDIPVVFTIHNMGYHGLFTKDALDRVGIPQSVFHPGGIEFYGKVNLLKGGLVYSDYLTTVSRKYAEEIQTTGKWTRIRWRCKRARRLAGGNS